MKNDIFYVKHINDAILLLLEYVDGYDLQKFQSDKKTQDACIRQIEIVGEASKKISEDFKSKNSEIPWKYMVGMRNKLIHDYFGVDVDVVWTTLIRDIPKLDKQIAKLV